MTKLFISFLCALHSIAFSNDYSKIDSRVKRYPSFQSIKDLGYRIQNDFKKDEERVRAAFIWVTHNMTYEQITQEEENEKAYIRFKNEKERRKQLRLFALEEIKEPFLLKKGVCKEYSLILNELCMQFGLPSKVITGLSKTKIDAYGSEIVYKNHTWNAVQINGEWKLMDPTYASGYLDIRSNEFIRKHTEHFFFTDPEDFAKHHHPVNPEWQLLKNPISIQTFYSAPYYFPKFFEKGIELSSKTSGILKTSDTTVNYVFFDKLPEQHGMHYSVYGSGELRRLGFKKLIEDQYVSRIRLKKKLYKNDDLLTIFMDEEPILIFKIKDPGVSPVLAKLSK